MVTLLDEESMWILLNMNNALKNGFMVSFEIFTEKLLEKENPFNKDSEQYEIFEEMKKLYNKELRDMFEIYSVAKKLCK